MPASSPSRESWRKRLFVDVTPLRESREYRLLFVGEGVTAIGNQLTMVAAPLQVYSLTESSLAVGLLGLAEFVPLLLGSFVGGALADAHDRRRVLLMSQALLALASVALAFNAFSANPQLWLIYVLTAIQAALYGIDSPTRTASVPALVRRDLLASALTLQQLLFQIAVIVGPALAGILIANVGVTVVYVLDVITFVLAIGVLAMMRPLVPHGGGTKPTRSSVFEGIRYIRREPALQGSFVVDINAMVFGMPRALFPALGTTMFGGAAAVGLLYAAPGAGALLGATLSGWLLSVDRQGRAVVYCVVVWGASIALFGLVPWLPLALFLLALAGAADVVSAVFRNSMLHHIVPDRLRGRLSAIHLAVVAGGPRLGDVEAGTAAALTNPTFSVVSGGLICMAGAGVVARLIPAFTSWRLSDHRHAKGDGAGGIEGVDGVEGVDSIEPVDERVIVAEGVRDALEQLDGPTGTADR